VERASLKTPACRFMEEQQMHGFEKRRLALFGVTLAAGVVTAGIAFAQQGGRPLEVTMTGAAETPKGDADGTGTATLRINPGQGQVCYKLTVANIATATAAHIHKGAAGTAGGPVVPLKAPAGGSVEDCATVSKEVAEDMIKNPANYYVNVHNAEFPGGALRGQLGK
jgi:hypothetical protein